jgi:hypothetical protein
MELMIINEHLRLLSSGPQLLIETSVLDTKNKATHSPNVFIVACMFQIKGSSITVLDGSFTFGMSDSDMSIIKYWNRLGGSIWDNKLQYQKQYCNICYVALFICTETKAIRLEFESNFTFEAFIAALKHLIDRRV